MDPVVIKASELNKYLRKHMRRVYHEKQTAIVSDTFVYIPLAGGQVGVDIAVDGGELFDLPEEILYKYAETPTLANSIFLWMFVIRKFLQDTQSIRVPLDTSIIIDLADMGSEGIESVRQISGEQQPMDMSDLLAFLNVNNEAMSNQVRQSLRLFGVTFSKDDIVTPALGFDVFDSNTARVTSEMLMAEYLNLPEFSSALMTYVFAITSINYSEIDAINSNCIQHHLLLVNSTIDHAVNTTDTEHSERVYRLGNKQCGQLLAQLGGSRAEDKKHSHFKDIVKLYSLLADQDREVCIAYNDFADHTFMDSNTSEVGMTEGQLRALALFHLQHPDDPIDFENMPAKQQADYCRFVADLADRKEGTLSDRLMALNSKQIGKLYTIATPSYKRHFVRLDSIKLSSSNTVSNNSFYMISIPVNKLASCIKFADNRPAVTLQSDQVYYSPLPYGENPFDYRPDFMLDPLAAAPKLHKLTCIGSSFYCDYTGDTTTQQPIDILQVLPVLMKTDILKPIMQAELLDFVDYGSKHTYDVTGDKADISLCKDVAVSIFGENNDNANITPLTVGRSLQEKSFIVNAFIHRLLRYFESVMQEQSDGNGIARRILSLADLFCYRDNGDVYVGVADRFESSFEVTPLTSTITIESPRRYTAATEQDDSSLANCVMVLPKRVVKSITPTTIFNRKDELPSAVCAIVSWLNQTSNSKKAYEDYVSYGLKFDSWDEYLVLQSCSAAGSLAVDTQLFFGSNTGKYATLTSGCEGDIRAAYLEYQQGIISKEEYISRTEQMCDLYASSILTIPLYSLEITNERNVLCASEEVMQKIDFRFFKNVRLQYSPISIFGTWNAQHGIVSCHVSMLT